MHKLIFIVGFFKNHKKNPILTEKIKMGKC